MIHNFRLMFLAVLLALAAPFPGCGDKAGQVRTDAGVDAATSAGEARDAPDGTARDTLSPADRLDPQVDAAKVTTVTIVVASDIVQDGLTDRSRAAAAHITGHTPAVTAIITAGDNVRYMSIVISWMDLLEYFNTYWKPAAEANWGQFDAIIFPQLGNHEYLALPPQGYFDYFKTRLAAIAAMPSHHGFVNTVSKGYYSFDLNGWHVVSLNSNCLSIGGCQAGSAQETWLTADLAAHPNMPIIAAWHAPRYTCGGSHADATEMQALWAALYDARADFVFNGHNHYYQRWQPLNKAEPQATVDSTTGLTEIVAGSIGSDTCDVCANGSDARVAAQMGGDAANGLFFLNLGSDGAYSYEYRLGSDSSVFDSGSGVSHNAP